MKNLKRTTLNLQVLSAEKEDGVMEFKGVANGFHTIDCYNSIMTRGAFKRDLPAFLEDGFIGGINHDWDKPIGKPLEAEESDKGLETRARLSDTDAGREVHTLMKDGVIKRLSIGYRVLDHQLLETEKEVQEYWAKEKYTPSDEDKRQARYGALLLKRVRLYEYSPVMLPGNSLTDISQVLNGQRAGQPLEDHLNSVLAADEELLVRIEGLLKRRTEEGRRLSAMWQVRLRRLRDQYAEMLRSGAPDFTPQREDNKQAAEEYLKWLEKN